MEEVFRDIIGYEGLYQIGNKGTIKSYDKYYTQYLNPTPILYKGKTLTPTNNKNILRISLIDKQGKRTNQAIHRLVAIHFIPMNIHHSLLDVKHINGNTLDNNYTNLKWANKPMKLKVISIDTENTKHSIRKPVSQYTLEDKFVQTFDSIITATLYTNIKGISRVCNNKRKQAGGYKWKFVNNKS